MCREPLTRLFVPPQFAVSITKFKPQTSSNILYSAYLPTFSDEIQLCWAACEAGCTNEHSGERLFIVSVLSPHLTMLCLYPLVCEARNFVAKSLIK